MNGKSAWRDCRNGTRSVNVFVERLWRTIKYEEVYLRVYASVLKARAPIGRLYRLLKRDRASFITWQADARSGVSQNANVNPGASVTGVEIHLAAAQNLFRQMKPLPGSPLEHHRFVRSTTAILVA
jgi:hypothetical protein